MKHLLVAIIMAIISIYSSSLPVKAFDEREIKMRLVLEQYNSPMIGIESELIQIAESADLDWTLMAAIAGTESSFGRRMPNNCVNPYGWGIYGDHRLCFASFSEAARAVATGLQNKYNTTSMATIAKTYNSVSTDSWLKHTQFFINKIKNTDIPVERLPITL